ncbi:DUF484 family protein [Mycoavidus sp. B2-EB]|uniref:DUF484 family protein n=1 Tax=Mycoavidus sp. B2-EB TaxID=2651972 RepID=UPI0016284AF4|nr:DUF484 family protein [Mycoavidus sp. B2-EB]BBO58969.1 hypothetical protein MPB2EB_0064 [Mycoavidus sp. B2-EB]
MNDNQIAEYLLAHPEFFERQAELLASVRLANPHGGRAVSLHERQMDILRAKNKQLERHLAQLMHQGQKNDGLMFKLGILAKRILAEQKLAAVPQLIEQVLGETFEVAAAVRIWDVAAPYMQEGFVCIPNHETSLLANQLARPYCGNEIKPDVRQWLTADTASESFALVALRNPLGDEANAFGLLVLGAPDAQRFQEGMATDFLSYMGVLVSAALSRLLASSESQ